DADFSSLTSFYPLAYKPSFYARGLKRLATLPFILQLNGYTTAAFHANKAGFWGRSSAFGEMGFKRFYSLRDYAGLPGKGVYVADGPFLDRTLEYLEKTVEPYFAYVITMSSHGDYNKLKYVSGEMLDKGISVPGDRQTENYFRVINYVDTSLREFYTGIMAQKKPFVMVIYGDHTSGLKSDEYVSRTDIAERVPLFIINSNEDGYQKYGTPSSQIDLPPTILSLVGIPSPSDWQGIDLISQGRERLYLKNQRVSVEAAGEVKTLPSSDRVWEETVFAVENYIR
ncbi:LTA synthase family protein, partial [bacterium]|nr:LTA synthase family protein [bacterium]